MNSQKEIDLKSMITALAKSATVSLVIEDPSGSSIVLTVSSARFLTVLVREKGEGEENDAAAVIPVGVVTEKWIEGILDSVNAIEGQVTPLEL